MLAFFDRRHTRRSFLQVGSLALGGLSLADLLAAKAHAVQERRPIVKDKAVVFLFLHGGPSQIETFDPKMTAPVEFRSVTGEVPTRIPGVTFGGSFPRLAALADRVTVIRSFVTGDGNHDIKPIVGRDTFGANLGSIYARIAGRSHPTNGLPTNVLLLPRAVDQACQPGTTNFGRFNATGLLAPSYAPFDPSAGSDLQSDMRLSIPMDRLGDRRFLLSQLDYLRWETAESRLLDDMDRTREMAFQTVLSGVTEAFNLNQESPRVVDRYDTARLV